LSHKQKHNSSVQLGRGPAFSQDAVVVLWKTLISKNPATDWAKGRVLTMMVTMVVLIWALVGIMKQISPGMGVGANKSGLTLDGTVVGSAGEKLNNGNALTGERLRNDLFKIPKPKKDNSVKTPKTNPVELLALIELQGVLGGKNPRAIVLYKRPQKTSTVSVGDDLGEFKVVEIRDRSVVLKWREELFELSL
jgi:hypothetical protein